MGARAATSAEAIAEAIAGIGSVWMKTRSIVIALTVGLVAASGCAKDEECKVLAEHVAEVVAEEQGGTLSAENREKMVKETAEQCGSEKPKPAVMKCALAASSTGALKECDKIGSDG